MSTTLDGMSVEQLRELAQRAEATAKQKEQAEGDAQYAYLGKISNWGWRVRKSDGNVEFKWKGDSVWHTEDGYTRQIGKIIHENYDLNIENMGQILLAAAKKKKNARTWK